MADLLSMFDELEANTSDINRQDIVKAPFGWPGGKSRSIRHLLKYLPYGKVWVDVFGGSGTVTLAREPSPLEVYNDRYGGVTAFYHCIKDYAKMTRLIEWLDLTVDSREEFLRCHDTWQDVNDDVERAARWYYMTRYSFGQLGRHWGRSTSGGAGNIAGRIRRSLPDFPVIHKRLENVQIENLDFETCMRDYDSHNTIFYLDPPYIDTHGGNYKEDMKRHDHDRLHKLIFECKGFVALSGYRNPMIDHLPWDSEHSWESYVSLQSLCYSEGSTKKTFEGQESRKHAEEVLWIKEAS